MGTKRPAAGKGHTGCNNFNRIKVGKIQFMKQLAKVAFTVGSLLGSSLFAQVVNQTGQVAAAPAEVESPLKWHATSRTAHETVWAAVSSLTNPATGSLRHRTNSYTAVATGINYLKDGLWVDSREEIELFEGGAIGRQSSHTVVFAPNINTVGAIEVTTDRKSVV